MTTALSATDQKVLDKYELFVNKLQEIEQEEASYQTNGRFYYNPSNHSTQINIFNCSTEELLNVHSFIRRKSEDYYASASELGVKQPPVFKWCAFSDDKWVHDMKLAIKLKNSIELKERLKRAIATLESVLPDELKKQRILESMEKEGLPF